MLVLTRRYGEIIDMILEDGRIISLTLLGIKGSQVRLGFDADKTITIVRREIEPHFNKLNEANGNA